MSTPLGKSRMSKHMLVGACAVLLLIAASQGYSQPTSHAETWLEEQANETSSGIAKEAAAEIDKPVLPSDSPGGSLLDKILELLGLGGSSDPATQKSVNPSGTAEQHMDRVDDRRAADASLQVAGSGADKGPDGPAPELTEDFPKLGPAALKRQEADDEKLASQSSGLWSGISQFWGELWGTDLSPEDSPEMRLSELDIYAIIVLAGLGVLGLLAFRRKAA
jgi:hypothetical protein